MCYDVTSLTRSKLKYAKARGASEEDIQDLQRKLEVLEGDGLRSYYHVNGFSHPNLLVFTNEEPFQPNTFKWGLIPFWVKDSKSAATISNQTLNARGETIFEKPSFRGPAKNKRCLIYVDSFFEHHHIGGKTFPFHVSLVEDMPMVLAGLWDQWTDKETGEIVKTVSIVTTEANELMKLIHNNPKAEGPRMPVILNREDQDKWLVPVKTEIGIKDVCKLIKPFDPSLLKAYPVRRLRGKESIGNVPEAHEKIEYQELADFLK
jgi:putative SOS response-associated peptidase YedK